MDTSYSIISKCRWLGLALSEMAVVPTVPRTVPAYTASPTWTFTDSARLA